MHQEESGIDSLGKQLFRTLLKVLAPRFNHARCGAASALWNPSAPSYSRRGNQVIKTALRPSMRKAERGDRTTKLVLILTQLHPARNSEVEGTATGDLRLRAGRYRFNSTQKVLTPVQRPFTEGRAYLITNLSQGCQPLPESSLRKCGSTNVALNTHRLAARSERKFTSSVLPCSRRPRITQEGRGRSIASGRRTSRALPRGSVSSVPATRRSTLVRSLLAHCCDNLRRVLPCLSCASRLQQYPRVIYVEPCWAQPHPTLALSSMQQSVNQPP